MKTWMLYGANGYTGKLIAEVAAGRGMRPICAGRDEAKVGEVAGRYGFDVRVFSLEDPDRVARELEDVDVVVLAAGPFSRTSQPVMEACLRSRTHYLDITGEVPVFERCHARDSEAKARGIVVMPGVGFDVVPSDCLAASLKEQLPDATELELAFAGGKSSAGTTKTMVEALPYGGAVRENGAIKRVPHAWKSRDVPFRNGTRVCVSIPWGDVSTAFYSTGIPNIIVYTYMPRRLVRAVRAARPLLWLLKVDAIQNAVKKRVERSVTGPDAREREANVTQLWGRVANAAGKSLEGTLVTPDGYALTAATTVESAHRVLEGQVPPGAHTPSMAFGAAYITEFPGCELQLGAPPTGY